MGKVREVYLKEQDESVPTLRAVDKRKVTAKLKMVNRILHNCLEDKMNVTKVNRLLYAGAWVVTEKLGMIGGKVRDGKRKEKKKPHWQQRIEKSISEWRKDLGRVEDLKRSGKFNDETMEKLDKKYNLLETGCLSVSMFQQNKIQTGSIKIKTRCNNNGTIKGTLLRMQLRLSHFGKISGLEKKNTIVRLVA